MPRSFAAPLILALSLPLAAVALASDGDAREGAAAFDCLERAGSFETRRFALEGRCKGREALSGCAYHDLRGLELGDGAGVDQRGVVDVQVTFPGEEHLWGALSIREPADHRFCWLGGTVVGRNPLAMTWAGPPGTKSRKNNFLLSQGGRMVVEGARVHNTHDTFLAGTPDAGFDIRDSWISWNRDDFFEGYLRDLRIDDTLIDGTFNFLSDPDGECDDAKRAADRVVVIEHSLIRLQRMPGPYARHTDRWHWEPEGGHNQLWKLDSCDWPEWPRFVLRDNVFLVEGPRTTRRRLNEPDCRLGLPSDCETGPSLANLVECRNNLFLYTDYRHWRDAGVEPGAVPRPGGRFHAADNPDFLPNGEDCYQRLTDDPRDPGHADVLAVWQGLRSRWIARHTSEAPPDRRVMRVPGVDYPAFARGTRVTIRNRLSDACLTSRDDGVPAPRPCDGSSAQRFEVEPFDDGKLAGAVLLRDERGRYLRSAPPPLDGSPENGGRASWPIRAESPLGEEPAFAERWYLLPLEEVGVSGGTLFELESDVIGRSFLAERSGRAAVQSFFVDGVDTPLPQPRFSHGDDPALQWWIESAADGEARPAPPDQRRARG